MLASTLQTVRTPLLAALIAGVAVSASTAKADPCAPAVVQNTQLLARYAQHLYEDIQFELRGSRHYQHLRQDAAELVEAAQHLALVTVQGASASHLQEDLTVVQQSVEHLETIFAQTGMTPAIDRTMRKLQQLILALRPHCTTPVVVPAAPVVVPLQAVQTGRYPVRGPVVAPVGRPFPTGTGTWGSSNRYSPRTASGVFTVQLGNVRLQFAK